jgi:hypothetical protein
MIMVEGSKEHARNRAPNALPKLSCMYLRDMNGPLVFCIECCNGSYCITTGFW